MAGSFEERIRDQLQRDLGKIAADFEGTLRDFARLFSSDLGTKTFRRRTTAVQPAKPFPEPACAEGPWSPKQFASMLVQSAVNGAMPSVLPDVINLGGLRTRLDVLDSLTRRTAVEWGQVGFSVVAPPAVVFAKEPQRGGPGNVFLSLNKYPDGCSPLDCTPTIMLHSHPTGSPHGFHLSDKDFVAFLSSPTVVVSGVIHRGRSLFAVKSAISPTGINPEECATRLEDILSECSRSASSPGGAVRRFTEEAAIYYGLSLYVTLESEPSVARKVRPRGN